MHYVLVIFSAFTITLILISYIIFFSNKHQLFDRNTYLVKNRSNISRLGGLGIFTGFFSVFVFYTNEFIESPGFLFHLPVCMVFLVGFFDDLYGISALKKFLIQLVIASVVVLMGEFNFRTQLFDVLTLSVFTSNIFFIVLFVFVINAFNLIDGIDGLACTLGILTNLFLGIVLLLNGDELYAGMALILAASLSGFLVFNYCPAKVYMGDSGSMVVGVISYLVALRFIELNDDILYSIHTSSIIVLALFSVPVYDTFRVFFLRLFARKSPFNRDRTHIHHRLKNLGLLDFQIVMLLIFYTLCMVSLVIIFQQIGDLLLCIFLLASNMLFNQCIDRQLKKAEVKN